MKCLLTTIVLMALACVAGPEHASPAGGPVIERSGDPGVTVTFLANEGFLIGGSTRSVIIDGFVTMPYSKYGAVEPSAWKKMLAREAPFDNVVLALVSHVHGDHFQPQAAMDFLQAHPETTLVSSPSVRAQLESKPGFDQIAGRIQSLEPAWGERLTFEADGVRVQFLHLPHGGLEWSEIHNFGHIIELDGSTVVHIGDAQQGVEPYEAVGLSEVVFDVALIPYWMYSPLDMRDKRRVAFLGNEVAEQLFGAGDPVGQMLRVHGSPFTVVGVMKKKTQDSSYRFRDKDMIVIPATTMRALTGQKYMDNFVFTGPRALFSELIEIDNVTHRRIIFLAKQGTWAGPGPWVPVLEGPDMAISSNRHIL